MAGVFVRPPAKALADIWFHRYEGRRDIEGRCGYCETLETLPR